MPTNAEVRAQLTGPGGMFEVGTEEVARPADGGLQGAACRRSAGGRGRPDAGRRPDLHRLRRPHLRLRHLRRRRPTAWPTPCATGSASRKGDRVAVLSQNNPEWCLTFWATSATAPILVGLNGWWTTDEIVYGLQDSGAKVLVADRKRFERIAGAARRVPDLEHVFLIDCSPADVGLGRRPAAAPLRRAHRPTHRHDFVDQDDRRGRRRGHLLHVGHDGPAEGRDLHPPEHDRQPPEHDVQRGRRRR